MNLNSQWIVGFVDGEGCFHIGISRHSEMKRGVQVLPEFTVVQHKRDIQLLHGIKEFFKCGVVRVNHGNRFCFRVRDLKHLNEIIIPFFEKHSLKTSKNLDFLKFREVVSMMMQKQHLVDEGEKRIKEIASKMNRGR